MKDKKRDKKRGLKMKELNSPVADKKSITAVPDRLNSNGRLENSYQSCSSDATQTDYVDLLEASGVVIKDITTSSISSHSPLMSSVTNNLRLCKKHVMHPYYKLLFMIGWRPFGKNCNRGVFLLKTINFIFPFFVLMLLFFSYTIEILTCEGRRTGVALFSLETSSLTGNSSSNSSSNSTLKKLLNNTGPKTHQIDDPTSSCRQFFGSYLLPAIFHALAYLIGLYHFRFQENEGFYSVMEKVYLQSSQPSRITKRLRYFMLIGIIWLIFGTSMSILMFYTYGLSAVTGVPSSYPIWRVFFTCLLFLGSFMTNCVNVCVVINYGGQCQLLIFYLKHVESILVEKSVSFKDAMKKLLDIKTNIQRLNSLLGWSASFMIIAIFLSIIINSGKLSRNYKEPFVKLGYRIGFCCQGILIVLFSLAQACRVTSTGATLKINLLSMRCYGYQHYNQMEIDSFINFLSLIKLETKLFSIPMKTRYLLGIIILATIALFIIFQTSLPANI